VLLCHGISEHSGRYEHVGRQLAEAGYDVHAYDLRGFGGSGGTRAHVDRFSEYVDDLHDLIDELCGADLPVVLIGHSMGGLIALGCVLEHEPRPDLLVLSAPALGATTPAWARLGAKPLARLAPRLRVKAPFDPSVLSRDPRVGAAYVADPLVERAVSCRLGAVFLEEMARVSASCGSLRVPTLCLHGSDDGLVPVGSTAVLGDIDGVERRIVEGARHELFNEPEGPEIVGEIIDWIDEQLSPS
jgi:alpha-beta hydrolase superfamily lysophospholipase